MSRLATVSCRCCCGCGTVFSTIARFRASDEGGPRCQVCNAAQHFDAAKRASDAVRLHLVANRERAIHSWVAIRLSDGGSDNVLYDSKHAAVRHQLHEYQCAYVKIPPDGFPPKAAEAFLRFNRQLYDHGLRLADPDKDLEVIMPLRQELSP
jgi:hypothetical protein